MRRPGSTTVLLLPATSSQPVTAGDGTHLGRGQSSCDFDEVVVSELLVDVDVDDDDDDFESDFGSDVDLEVDLEVDDVSESVSVSVDGLVERVPELSFVVEVSERLPVRVSDPVVSDPVVSVEVGAAGVTATRADGSRSTVARFPTA